MIKTRRIIEIVVIVFAVIFIVYQGFASYYSALTTESAVFYEHVNGVLVNGTIIRSEHEVTMPRDGTIHFVIGDGERVAKGGVIARVYSSDAESAAAERIKEIDEQLADIAEIEGYNNTTAVDMGTLNEKLNTALNTFLFSVSNNSFNGAENAKNELLNALTRRQVATGITTDFSVIKAELNNEKNSLASMVGTPKSECFSSSAGYFVSGTDGYEGQLNSKDLTLYTPEYLNGLKVESGLRDVVGKIVDDYEWYIAVVIPLEDAMNYTEGQSFKIEIEAAAQIVNTEVKKVNISKTSDTASVIFSCHEMSSELATMRSGKMTIISDEYSGIRISKKAIRIENGVSGVYVVSGIEAKFVTVNILFSNEEYAICELNTANNQKLRLYDNVIVKGRGLYDGKIIY